MINSYEYEPGDEIRLAVAVVVFLVLVILGSRIVRPNRALIIERRGHGYFKTLSRGYHLFIPGIDKVRARLDLRPQAFKSGPLRVVASDGVEKVLHVTVIAQIMDPHAAVYQVANYRDGIAEVSKQAAVHGARSRHSMQLIGDQRVLEEEVRGRVAEAVAPWGIQVSNVQITASS